MCVALARRVLCPQLCFEEKFPVSSEAALEELHSGLALHRFAMKRHVHGHRYFECCSLADAGGGGCLKGKQSQIFCLIKHTVKG